MYTYTHIWSSPGCKRYVETCSSPGVDDSSLGGEDPPLRPGREPRLQGGGPPKDHRNHGKMVKHGDLNGDFCGFHGDL